jgi:isopropylmalate/homocitrate/citramalate synthase
LRESDSKAASKCTASFRSAFIRGLAHTGNFLKDVSSGFGPVSLPSSVARRVKTLARRKRTSANRIIVDLIETGLEAREREKRAFFEIVEQLTRSSDAVEQKRLKEELARMTFGE